MQYGDYKIVHYTSDYQDAVLDLFSQLWGADRQSNSAYLKWKYELNPYADRYWIYLAIYDGQLVGVRGNTAMRWQFGDPVQYVDWMCDSDHVIKSEHRRKGLYQALTQFNIQELEKISFRHIVTSSANEAATPRLLKMGWKPLGPTQPFVRLRPAPVPKENKLRSFARRFRFVRNSYKALRNIFSRPAPTDSPLSKLRNPFDTLDAQKSRLKEKFDHLFIENVARPQEMAELVARLPADGHFSHVRNTEYFNWRYLNPRSNYRFLFWGEQPLEGYLILQTPARPGMDPVTIVDWEGHDMLVRTELFKAAIQLGDFDVLSTWGISLTAQLKELLLTLGFICETESLSPESFQPSVLLRPVALEIHEADWKMNGKDLLDQRNWDFKPIYSDTY